MSDHISGPRALAEPIADITDVYAFPSPERQGHLVLVQNTLPFAQPSAPFSDGLVYRFRLRPLAAGAPSDPAPFAVAEEELAFTDPGAIYMDGKNVLSLVVEVDCAEVLNGLELVGVVAETLTRGKLNVRIERVGRPEVKNLMLAPKQFDPVNRDLEIRDLYNMEDAFHLAEGYVGAYRARLNANLAFWDGLDGKIDWPVDGNGIHPLTELVLADYLVVDVTKPYADQGSFFEIECATREGRAHETCGGRAPSDDVMDTIFTLLVNAGNGPVIRDGVDRATTPASHTFPYLAPPNPKPPEPPEHL